MLSGEETYNQMVIYIFILGVLYHHRKFSELGTITNYNFVRRESGVLSICVTRVPVFLSLTSKTLTLSSLLSLFSVRMKEENHEL